MKKWIKNITQQSLDRLRFIMFDADPEGFEFWLIIFAVAGGGWLLLKGDEIFSNPAFAVLAAGLPDKGWAGGLLATGCIQGLGSLSRSIWLRLIGVIAATFVWLSITVTVWSGHMIGISHILYPIFVLVSGWLAWRFGWRQGLRDVRK